MQPFLTYTPPAVTGRPITGSGEIEGASEQARVGRYAIWKLPRGTHWAGPGERRYHAPTYLLARLWDIAGPGERGRCEILRSHEPGRRWQAVYREMMAQAQALHETDLGPWTPRLIQGEWGAGDLLTLRHMGTGDLGWVGRADISSLLDALAAGGAWEGTQVYLTEYADARTLISTRSSVYMMPLTDEAVASLRETLADALQHDYIHPATRQGR